MIPKKTTLKEEGRLHLSTAKVFLCYLKAEGGGAA